MLKQARLLIRPTLPTTSPTRPESVKIASLPRDALLPQRGRRGDKTGGVASWLRCGLCRAENEVGGVFQNLSRLRENHFGTAELRWSACVSATNEVERHDKGGFPQDAQKVLPARPQASRNRRRTLCGYVEDFDEPRTKLEDFFSIRLGELVLCHAISECIAGDLEEPAGFGNIAACALQRFC